MLESRKSELIHLTNIESLISIINTGVLLGGEYQASSTEKKNRVEVATLRRSVESGYKKNPKKMAELTLNADGVKIYLFDKNIKSSLRGAKIKPISEFGKIFDDKEFKSRVRDFVEEINTERVTTREVEKFIDSSLRELSKKIRPSEMRESLYSKTLEMESIVQNFNRKFNIKISEYQRMSLSTAIRARVFSMFPYLTREGEERISVKGSIDEFSGVPVSEKYMKIRIEKEPSIREIKMSLDSDTKRLMLIKKIESSGNLFLKDRNFNKFLKILKEIRVD